MIQVSIELLFSAYLTVALLLISLAWLRARARTHRVESAARQHWLRCHLCAFAFEDHTADHLPRCPSCGSPNEREPLRDL